MATDQSTSLTEAELLYQYLGRRLENGSRKEPIPQLLADFAEYRRELDELRATLREAVAQSERGETGPIDLDDVIRRGRERLAAKGITD